MLGDEEWHRSHRTLPDQDLIMRDQGPALVLGKVTIVLGIVNRAIRFWAREAADGLHAVPKRDQNIFTLNNVVSQQLPIISTDVLNVCDIGGGDGKRIKKILEFLHEKFALRFNL